MRAMVCRIVIVAAAGLAGSTAASGAPVQWAVAAGGNGHYYDRVDFALAPLTWQASKTQAEAGSYSGEAGHLVTLTSAAENQFVYTQLLADRPTLQYFIGGYQPAGSAEPAGGWTWTTGEPWAYTNWYAKYQPDNNAYYGGENALSIYSGSSPQSGYWNDTADNRTDVPANWEHLGGYVVEYAPEPASVSVFAAGGLLVMCRRRSGR